MELKREQIIKALECCTVGIGTECEKCPYMRTAYCNDVLKKEVLALITSQEQKIKELTQANEQLSESYDHLEMTKDELLAERSRLTEENERLRAEGKWIEKHRHRGGFRTVTVTDSLGEKHTGMVDDRYETDDLYCSVCGKIAHDAFLNYCANCGAKMKGE